VSVSFGGFTTIATDFCFTSPLIVANTLSVPERVNGLRQVRAAPASFVGVDDGAQLGFELGTHWCFPVTVSVAGGDGAGGWLPPRQTNHRSLLV